MPFLINLIIILKLLVVVKNYCSNMNSENCKTIWKVVSIGKVRKAISCNSEQLPYKQWITPGDIVHVDKICLIEKGTLRLHIKRVDNRPQDGITGWCSQHLSENNTTILIQIEGNGSIFSNLAEKIIKDINNGIALTSYMHRSIDPPYNDKELEKLYHTRPTKEQSLKEPFNWYGVRPNDWRDSSVEYASSLRWEQGDKSNTPSYYASIFGEKFNYHVPHYKNKEIEKLDVCTKLYYVDCAGFIRSLITNTLGENSPAYAEIRQHDHWGSDNDGNTGFLYLAYPRAHVFADFFQKGGGKYWQSVSPENILAGDIIAWYPLDTHTRAICTGHIWVALTPPDINGNYYVAHSTSNSQGGGIEKKLFNICNIHTNINKIYGIGRLR